MTWLAIVALVAWCFFWIIRDDLRTKREAAWHAHIESIITDTSLYPGDDEEASNVVSVREAPAFDRIADLLALNEARRFDAEDVDWDEPAAWTERRP